MINDTEIPRSISLFLKILQVSGWLMILIFLLTLGFSFIVCPPWNCYGESGVVYFLPFMAFFTALPLGTLFVISTRKSRGQKKYEKTSLRRFENTVFGLGLFFIFIFLGIICLMLTRCASWECVRGLSQFSIFLFVNIYTALPLGIFFLIMSKKLKKYHVVKVKDGCAD
jgi:hypothetical protein